MFELQGQVISDKLLVQAKVSSRPRSSAGGSAPRIERDLVMMVDTGARQSALPESVAISLGAPKVGDTEVSSFHGVQLQAVYPIVVSVEFADEYGASAEAEMPLGMIARNSIPPPVHNVVVRHQGILGMDFLKHFRLLLDGPGQRFELSCSALPRIRAPK